MDDIPKLFVARFISHPLGDGRYVKDFRHNLTGWDSMWWKILDDAGKVNHFRWSLRHHQYHYSTADINKADFWHCDEHDFADREILAKYAPVEYLPVNLKVV